MGAILEAAERGSHQEVLGGLYNARAGVLGLLPAIAGEGRFLPLTANPASCTVPVHLIDTAAACRVAVFKRQLRSNCGI